MGFTLDKIRQEAEKRYGSFSIEDAPNGELKLRAALRLPDEKLEKLQELSESLKSASENGDQKEDLTAVRNTVTDILALTAGEREADWREYASQLDRAELLFVYEAWASGTQEGEA